MPSTQFMDNPIDLWVNYDSAPARITSISYANDGPVAVSMEVQRNNGLWNQFTIPAGTLLTQIAVNPNQYTLTVDAAGEVDVAPNFRSL